MKRKFVEAVGLDDGRPANWGKFLVGRFDEEDYAYESRVGPPASLLRQRGWSENHILVLDLETGEGGMFPIGGEAAADLDKHRIWVCPLFEPFLAWLYRQDLSDLSKLPDVVHLKARLEVAGYRRNGVKPGTTDR